MVIKKIKKKTKKNHKTKQNNIHKSYRKTNKKSKIIISSSNSSSSNSSNSSNSKILYPVEFELNEKQIELLLFTSSIVNHFLFLMKNNIPKSSIKKTMLNLFKELRHHNQYISIKTTDIQLNIIFNNLYSEIKKLKKQIDKEYKYKKNSKINKINKNIKKSKNFTKGGFYFKSLEEKGDQPLTGTDLATLLDEMQQFFYNAQYVDEGKFLQDTNLLISMFRGDLGQFKGMVQYKILPQYYQVTPPFIKWDNIKKAFEEKKYEDIPDYLLAYQSYLRSRDEYLVAKGLKSPSVLQGDTYTGFFNKLANSLDKNITQFQQYRNKLTGKVSPIALPV